MPYYNETSLQRRINYVEYVDSFAAEDVCPSAGMRNFILMFDNFEGKDTLSTLEGSVHTLYQMTVMFVMRGSIVLNINGKDVTVKAGQVLTTMPDNAIRYMESTTDVCYFMYVIYPKVMSHTFADVGRSYTHSEFSRATYLDDLNREDMDYCYSIYTTMKEDMKEPPYEYKLIFQRSWLNVLLVQLLNFHKITQQNEGDANSRQYDVYCRFLEALNKYSGTQRSVQYYADMLGISSKYLSFVCISYSKKNASSWIGEYVTQKAKVLMSVHHYSVLDTSEALNFQTSSSFSRYFKRVTGITPKEYITKNS